MLRLLCPRTSLITLNGKKVVALLEASTSGSFIDKDLVCFMNIPTSPGHGVVSMASTAQSSKGLGRVSIQLKDSDYHGVELSVFPPLCSNVIVGQDFLKQHSSLTIEFGD